MQLPLTASLRRPFVWVGLILVLASLTLVAYTWSIKRQVSQVEQHIAQLQASLKVEAENQSQLRPPADVIDFAQRLPATAPTTDVIREIQRSAKANGVVFASFDVSSRVATTQTLGKTDLSFRLQGSYANIKRVLKDVLGRYPVAVLAHLQIQRASSPMDLAAQVELVLLSKAFPSPDRADIE